MFKSESSAVVNTIEAPPTRLLGVILDMDGVLLESEPFIAEAAVRMFAEKGTRVTAADFRPFIGTGEDRFLGGVAELKKVKLDMPRDKERTYEIYVDLIAGPEHRGLLGCDTYGSEDEPFAVGGEVSGVEQPAVGEHLVLAHGRSDLPAHDVRRVGRRPGGDAGGRQAGRADVVRSQHRAARKVAGGDHDVDADGAVAHRRDADQDSEAGEGRGEQPPMLEDEALDSFHAPTLEGPAPVGTVLSTGAAAGVRLPSRCRRWSSRSCSTSCRTRCSRSCRTRCSSRGCRCGRSQSP